MQKLYTINETYYWKKIVKELFRSTQSSFDYLFPGVISYLAKCLRDVSIVLVVDQYYAASFSDSIEKFIEERWVEVLWKYPECVGIINRHALFLEKYLSQMCHEFRNRTIIDIEVLGDVHPGRSTKVELITDKGSYIVFGNRYDSQKTLIEYISAIDSTLSPCLVERSQSKSQEYRYRRKHEINQLSGSRKEVELYYYYFWKMIARLLLFQISDQYHENVLCAAPYPVFFDIEVAFCWLLEQYNITSMGVIAQDNSQFATLNGWKLLMSYTIPVVTLKEWKPLIERIIPSKNKKTSTPISTLSQQVKKEQMLKGFTESTIMIENNLSQIIDFIENTQLYSRLILRPTREYIMLGRTFQYKLLQDNDYTYKQRIQTVLWDKYIYQNFSALWEIGEYEKKMLIAYIVPSFYADTRKSEIMSVDGERLWKSEQTHFALRKQHISKLDGFFEKQKEIITQFL